MGCFGGGTTTTVQTNNLPAWLSGAGETLYNQAQSIGAQPYTPYNQPRIAGFTPDTMSAFQKPIS